MGRKVESKLKRDIPNWFSKSNYQKSYDLYDWIYIVFSRVLFSSTFKSLDQEKERRRLYDTLIVDERLKDSAGFMVILLRLASYDVSGKRSYFSPISMEENLKLSNTVYLNHDDQNVNYKVSPCLERVELNLSKCICQYYYNIILPSLKKPIAEHLYDRVAALMACQYLYQSITPLDKFSEKLFHAIFNFYLDFMSEPDMQLISINSYFPVKEIENYLNTILESIKQDHASGLEACILKLEIGKWNKYQSIAYHDLVLWADIENLEYERSYLVDKIAPDNVNKIKFSDNVKNTGEKYRISIFKLETLKRLFYKFSKSNNQRNFKVHGNLRVHDLELNAQEYTSLLNPLLKPLKWTPKTGQ